MSQHKCNVIYVLQELMASCWVSEDKQEWSGTVTECTPLELESWR